MNRQQLFKAVPKYEFAFVTLSERGSNNMLVVRLAAD